MLEYHKISDVFWCSIHPIWLWYQLYHWQKLRQIYIEMNEKTYFYSREIAQCDHFIDLYCDFIDARIYWPVPYAWGYHEDIYIG